MAENSLLIRIGIDPSGAVTGGKVVEDSLGGLDNRLAGLNQKFGQGAEFGDRLTHSLGRLGSAGRMDAFRMLSTDILIATTNMTGMGQASGLLRTGLFTLQSTLGAFLGPVGLAGVAIAGMAVVSMFTKKASATKLAREELDKNKTSVQDNTGALLELYKAGGYVGNVALSLFNERLKENNRLIENNMSLVEGATQRLSLLAMGQIDSAYATKEGINVTAELRAKLIQQTESLSKTNEELKKSANLQEELNNQLKIWGALEIGPARKLGVAIDVKPVKKAFESVSTEAENSSDRAVQAFEDFTNKTRYHVGELSTAFVDMMMGVDVRWGDLLENMVKQLLASGLQNLIMDLLSGGGGGGILGTIFGMFQSGTSFVPRTGAYILHQGEAVIPANQNVYRSSVFNQQSYGDNVTVNVFQLDAKRLTKKDIVPVIKEMIRNREINLS